MEQRDKPMEQGDKPGRGNLAPQVKAALARLGDVLNDPQKRASFRSDPAGSVKGYKALPESARTTLEELSEPELDALAKSHQTLVDAGLYEEVEDEHGGGRVSFF
jgi:hypothetical protein